MVFILSPEEVLTRGFCHFAGLPTLHDEIEEYTEENRETFKRVYGSSPAVIANIWEDLVNIGGEDEGTRIPPKFVSEKGFKEMLLSIHFLWAYPRNAKLLATNFGVSLRRAQGEYLWRWVKRISALKVYKIVWPAAEYNDPEGRVFIATVDGVDFVVWERKHPTLPRDKSLFSHKHKHAAVKYEIAIDVQRSKVVRTSGPYKGGVHDKTMYVEGGLRDLIPQGKKIITDRVYGKKSEPDDHAKLGLPNAMDDPVTAKFKARARCRHETLNGRLCFFKSLSDTYRHRYDYHKHVFESVLVMVQYQMDRGGKLFET